MEVLTIQCALYARARMPSDPVKTVVDACDAGGGKEQGDIVAWRRRKRVTVSVTWPRLVTESMGHLETPSSEKSKDKIYRYTHRKLLVQAMQTSPYHCACSESRECTGSRARGRPAS